MATVMIRDLGILLDNYNSSHKHISSEFFILRICAIWIPVCIPKWYSLIQVDPIFLLFFLTSCLPVMFNAGRLSYNSRLNGESAELHVTLQRSNVSAFPFHIEAKN
jgi:hypothetical protein